MWFNRTETFDFKPQSGDMEWPPISHDLTLLIFYSISRFEGKGLQFQQTRYDSRANREHQRRISFCTGNFPADFAKNILKTSIRLHVSSIGHDVILFKLINSISHPIRFGKTLQLGLTTTKCRIISCCTCSLKIPPLLQHSLSKFKSAYIKIFTTFFFTLKFLNFQIRE